MRSHVLRMLFHAQLCWMLGLTWLPMKQMNHTQKTLQEELSSSNKNFLSSCFESPLWFIPREKTSVGAPGINLKMAEFHITQEVELSLWVCLWRTFRKGDLRGKTLHNGVISIPCTRDLDGIEEERQRRQTGYRHSAICSQLHWDVRR